LPRRDQVVGRRERAAAQEKRETAARRAAILPGQRPHENPNLQEWSMTRRDPDPSFDDEQIEELDPVGEIGFEAEGFDDEPDGRPRLGDAELEDDAIGKRPDRGGQKVAGIPERRQHEPNSSDLGRPDSEGVVIRERGGASKGDPAVGGTRPD
jgi:hypothetical protein